MHGKRRILEGACSWMHAARREALAVVAKRKRRPIYPAGVEEQGMYAWGPPGTWEALASPLKTQ